MLPSSLKYLYSAFCSSVVAVKLCIDNPGCVPSRAMVSMTQTAYTHPAMMDPLSMPTKRTDGTESDPWKPHS